MRSDRPSGERGTVTAELAACLPVLVLLLGVAISAVGVGAARVRCQDAAREAARASARGDAPAARALADRAAPGARVEMIRSATEVTAVVRLTVHPLGGVAPALTVTERAVAAVEPTATGPPP